MNKCFLVEPVRTPERLPIFNHEPWNDFVISHWENPLTGETKEWPHQFGVGAMWLATFYPKNFEWENEREPHLIVMTPGGPWDIDSRASNCTMKGDKKHRCWIRHGEAPLITVDKNGLTCGAGAGSIQCGNYHGFLRNGELT